jgi:hypothetical protein
MTKKPVPDTKEKLTLYVTLMVSTTLCISVLAMVFSFLLGLWGSRQRRDIQNDFTRFFYSYRRHDWLPIWYQTNAE